MWASLSSTSRHHALAGARFDQLSAGATADAFGCGGPNAIIAATAASKRAVTAPGERSAQPLT
jgi:hypothetical protein